MSRLKWSFFFFLILSMGFATPTIIRCGFFIFPLAIALRLNIIFCSNGSLILWDVLVAVVSFSIGSISMRRVVYWSKSHSAGSSWKNTFIFCCSSSSNSVVCCSKSSFMSQTISQTLCMASPYQAKPIKNFFLQYSSIDYASLIHVKACMFGFIVCDYE